MRKIIASIVLIGVFSQMASAQEPLQQVTSEILSYDREYQGFDVNAAIAPPVQQWTPEYEKRVKEADDWYSRGVKTYWALGAADIATTALVIGSGKGKEVGVPGLAGNKVYTVVPISLGLTIAGHFLAKRLHKKNPTDKNVGKVLFGIGVARGVLTANSIRILTAKR